MVGGPQGGPTSLAFHGAVVPVWIGIKAGSRWLDARAGIALQAVRWTNENWGFGSILPGLWLLCHIQAFWTQGGSRTVV